jgi:hypothetical protein
MPQLGEGHKVVSPMYVANRLPDSPNSTLEGTPERRFITLLRHFSANHPKVVLGAPKLLFKAGACGSRLDYHQLHLRVAVAQQGSDLYLKLFCRFETR